MKEVINIINQLRNESSTNGKIKILKDNKDNELLKKVLEYTYNPFKKYGVTEKVLIPTNEEFNNIELFQLLDLLSNSNINDSLRKTVNSFLGSIQFKEERDLYVCMLLKDLKIGCNSKTINKVWKDLIPSFNVMLADKYFEKQQKVKGKEFIITQKLDGSRFVLIKDNLGIALFIVFDDIPHFKSLVNIDIHNSFSSSSFQYRKDLTFCLKSSFILFEDNSSNISNPLSQKFIVTVTVSNNSLNFFSLNPYCRLLLYV